MSDAISPAAVSKDTVGVTGATGYVGGRLVPALLEAGYRVRCLAREPRKLDARPWRHHPHVEVIAVDIVDSAAVTTALQGCRAAFYLVHSMAATGGAYADHDRVLAAGFARAARDAGLSRIIYLGGLGEMGPDLSEHLRSRRQVEQELASCDVPVTTFRAAMIIGSGSASYEILRYLVERLPIMVIGGPDVMPYSELMRVMAEELGLRRRIILPVPLLTPRLSSLWINLVTPVSYRIARPLAEGLKNRVVVTDDTTQRLMPLHALGVREAIHRAKVKIDRHAVETHWSVAGPIPGDPIWAGGTVFTDKRVVDIAADSASVYAAVCRIGGGNGWYAGDVLWQVRGWLDKFVGGPGLRRGRRHPEMVEFGEALDFWRVVGIDRDKSLSLRAEMKLPGEAQLDFAIEEIDAQSKPPLTRLVMTARFRPSGLFGILYWYAVVPLHEFVFGGMLRGIQKTAEAMSCSSVIGSVEPPSQQHAPGYGRARLWLGMSAVGTMVVLATAGLALGLPRRLLPSSETLAGDVTGLAGFVLAYAALHLPFDLFGGYLLPKWYGRRHPSMRLFLARLARGVGVHSTLLFVSAVVLLIAGLGTDCSGYRDGTARSYT
ncbi:MAG: DUF2867 domain-containing protein [Planctomycetia bacterium]|nr:DUF2867 domain-containing protein [Planctomycetia bacterium]